MELKRVQKKCIETAKISSIQITPSNKPCIKSKKLSRHYLSDMLIVFLASLLVRLYRIDRGGFVIWDEAHFGKFSSYYNSRQFFFDVHPPLGKLLTAFSAWWTNTSSDFIFDSESWYPSSVDFVGMRIFHGVFGSLVPVCGYAIVRIMNMHRHTAVAIATSLVFENALVSVSRLILLDPFLVLFIATSEVFLARVIMDNTRLLEKKGIVSVDLLCLGASIGLAASVKWVGLLTVAHVGVFAAYILIAEVRKRRFSVAARLLFKLSVGLIVVPILIYILTFYVHFLILNRSGTGDGEMSSRFQSFLHGNEVLENSTGSLSYGNKITVRNITVGCGLLHSHVDKYPDGGQQVTTYPHKDSNNYWRVLKVGTDPEEVQAGDELVLHHIETNSYLAIDENSNAYNTIPENARKTICMTQEEMGGILPNTVFMLEPVHSNGSALIDPLNTLFFIRNAQYNCYLSFSGSKLPKWGHQQGQVICTSDKISGSVWNIEVNKSIESETSQLDNNASNEESSKMPKKATWRDFLVNMLELNKAMNVVNNTLLDDGTDNIGTQPAQWIFPTKWLKFNRWDGSIPRFAMIGNIITWYGGSANMPFLIIYTLYKLSCMPLPCRNKRGACIDNTAGNNNLSNSLCSNTYVSKQLGRMYLILGGYLFHLVPFFFVKRILYLHHYLPCLFFGTLGLAILLNKRFKLSCAFAVGAVASFVYMASVTYGYSGEIKDMRGYFWFSKYWNIYEE